MITAYDLRIRVRHLETEVARMAGRLAAEGIDYVPFPEWSRGLWPGEAATLEVLLKAHPRAVDCYALEEATRVKDQVVERTANLPAVMVSRLRKRFGKPAIETVWGTGYRLSDDFVVGLKADHPIPEQEHQP